MNIKQLIYLLFVSLFLVTCTKDKVEEPCTECQQISEAKEFFGFKVGSWWVYEEETTGARDSCYVTNAINYANNYSFDLEIYSTHRDYYYHYWSKYYNISGCSTTNSVNKKCLYVDKSKYKTGEFVSEDECFFVGYKIGVYSYNSALIGVCENSKTFIFDVLDNFSVNSMSFDKTVVVKNECSLFENAQPTYHYYSKNVGIVKFIFVDDSEAWNLVNYHIEQ